MKNLHKLIIVITVMAIYIGNPNSAKADKVDELVTALSDNTPKVRAEAAKELGELADPRAVQPLLEALKTKRGYAFVYKEIEAALVKIGEPVVEPLIAEAKDESSKIRTSAIYMLGQIGDLRAVDPLLTALKSEESYIRETAAKALCTLKWTPPPDVKLELLVIALSDNTPKVRAEAAKELGELADPRAIRPLLKALEDQRAYSFVRTAMKEALIKIGEPAVEPLVLALKDNDEGIRGKAAEVLGEMNEQGAVEPLVDVLQNDQEAKVRTVAAKALGRIGSEQTVVPIINALENDKEAKVRIAAANTLGKIKDARALEPLISAANKDSIEDVKVSAKSALLEFKDEKAASIYIDLLNSDSSEMRLKAALILSSLKHPRVKEVHTQVQKIIEEESYITEIIDYDQFSRPSTIILRNVEGKLVASKKLTFNEYNPRQIIEEEIKDLATLDVVHITKYDVYGKRLNHKWLCLDKNGNIIRKRGIWKKAGKPVLVDPFDAKQKSEFFNEYDGSYIIKKTTRIYPCKNCAEQTGLKNCRYVW